MILTFKQLYEYQKKWENLLRLVIFLSSRH